MKSVKLGTFRLGEGRPKVILPITEETEVDVVNCANYYRRQEADMVEWRIDYYEDFTDFEGLAELTKRVKTSIQKPLIATFRTIGEGGEAAIGRSQYVEMYRYIIEARAVDAIDVEFDRGQDILDDLIPFAHKHKVKVIVSHHDFIKTPTSNNLVEKLQALGQTQADICKIAVMPHDEADVLNLMTASQTASTLIDQPLITMAMGKLGLVTRLAGEIFNSAATFAAVDGMISAPGQIDLDTLNDALDLLTLSATEDED